MPLEAMDFSPWSRVHYMKKSKNIFFFIFIYIKLWSSYSLGDYYFVHDTRIFNQLTKLLNNKKGNPLVRLVRL